MLNFYPLEIGNYWEYEVISKPYNPDTSFYSVTVKSDTVLNNGFKYFVLEEKLLQTSEILQIRYERIDSINSRVYRFEDNFDYIVDSLLAISTSYAIDLDTSEYYEANGWSEGIVEDTVFGYPTYTKYVTTLYEFINKDYILAYGLGVIRELGGRVPYIYDKNLLFARINGNEYGRQVTEIDEEQILPNDFELFQNYPNPFNPETTIQFSLDKSSVVKLKIYNSLGEEVLSLLDEYLPMGNHAYSYNFRDLASGVYLYSLILNNRVLTKKMILLK